LPFINSGFSLALLYSFNLLNGIGFLKDFRAASPQRGSWQSQRRGAKRPADVCLAPTEAERRRGRFPCDNWNRLEIYGNHPLAAGKGNKGIGKELPQFRNGKGIYGWDGIWSWQSFMGYLWIISCAWRKTGTLKTRNLQSCIWV